MMFFILFPFQCFAIDSRLFAWSEKGSLHVKLMGEIQSMQWIAQDVKARDIAFYQNLFNDPIAMARYGNGLTQPPELTKIRVQVWIDRFEKGIPCGAMTVFDVETKMPIGFVIAGLGDAPGISELAYCFVPKVWGKGIAFDVVNKLVTQWAPHVREIGLTRSDDKQDQQITQNFRCFQSQPLERLYATASPSNIASWKVLTKNLFSPAEFLIGNTLMIIQIQTQDQDHIDYQKIEEQVLEKYFNSHVSDRLQDGICYQMVDPVGELRVVSRHAIFGRLKYHFILDLE